MHQSDPESKSSAEEPGLSLPGFFPYQLSILNDEVSRSVAQVYESRHALSRQQWRVLAVLGGTSQLTAKQIGEQTRMAKMPVSRATTQLEDRGLISRRRDDHDKRHHHFFLTEAGKDQYDAIVPHVLARESYLLSVLTHQEKQILEMAVAKLTLRSRELQSLG